MKQRKNKVEPKKIRVRYYSPTADKVRIIICTMDIFDLCKTDQYCIDIMDCETGEILYIKGL